MNSLLIVHVIVYKSNFFLTISTNLGKILLSLNSGCLGFKDIKKRTPEALNKILLFSIDFLSQFPTDSFILLKFENMKKNEFKKAYKLFVKKLKFSFLGFKCLIKIPHNGCRK